MTKLIHMFKIVQSPGILPKPSPIIPIIHTLFKSVQPFNVTYVTYVTMKTVENCCQESFWGLWSLPLWSFCLLDSPSVALSGPQWPSVALSGPQWPSGCCQGYRNSMCPSNLLVPDTPAAHINDAGQSQLKTCWWYQHISTCFANLVSICSSKVTNFGEC